MNVVTWACLPHIPNVLLTTRQHHASLSYSFLKKRISTTLLPHIVELKLCSSESRQETPPSYIYICGDKLLPAKSCRTIQNTDSRQRRSSSPWQPLWQQHLRPLALDLPSFSLDPGMAVSVEPGVGSKWQGLALQEQAKQGVHPRVEPDPLLDLAELEVRLRVEADPLLDLAKHSPRRLIN